MIVVCRLGNPLHSWSIGPAWQRTRILLGQHQDAHAAVPGQLQRQSRMLQAAFADHKQPDERTQSKQELCRESFKIEWCV